MSCATTHSEFYHRTAAIAKQDSSPAVTKGARKRKFRVVEMQIRAYTMLFCLLLAGCGGAPDDPETALREWVTKAETAAEDKDRAGLMALISGRYADARGNSFDSIGDELRVYFFRKDPIGLISTIDEISLLGDTAAMVNLTVAMASTYNSRLGFDADAYRFELELEMDGDEWLLIGARWGALGRDMR